MHIVLLRGAAVVSSALLSIGQMSKEGQKAAGKHFIECRGVIFQKTSRGATSMDIIHRLLKTSVTFDFLTSTSTPNDIKETGFSSAGY